MMQAASRLTVAIAAAALALGSSSPLQAQGGAGSPTGGADQRCASLRGEAQLEACRQALEAAPERPELWFHLGQALATLNRHDAATRAYSQAAQVVRGRRDLAVSRLPGYQQTVAPFLRDILRFEGQACQANVRAQRQEMDAMLSDAESLQQLEAAIASGQVEGEALARLREMQAEIRRFRNNPAALEERMQSALATCRQQMQAALEQLGLGSPER